MFEKVKEEYSKNKKFRICSAIFIVVFFITNFVSFHTYNYIGQGDVFLFFPILVAILLLILEFVTLIFVYKKNNDQSIYFEVFLSIAVLNGIIFFFNKRNYLNDIS